MSCGCSSGSRIRPGTLDKDIIHSDYNKFWQQTPLRYGMVEASPDDQPTKKSSWNTSNLILGGIGVIVVYMFLTQ